MDERQKIEQVIFLVCGVGAIIYWIFVMFFK